MESVVMGTCSVFFRLFLFLLLVSCSLNASSEYAFLEKNLNNLSGHFRKNSGQWEDRVLYQCISGGWEANVYFMKNEISYGFKRSMEEDENEIDEQDEEEKIEYLVWNTRFKNANTNVHVDAEGYIPSFANYLIGNDFARHVVNAADYKLIRYTNIYPNIDVRYYNTNGKLKHDYIVHANSDIDQIQLECNGIEKIDINEKGQLLYHTKWGVLVEEVPQSYQYIHGRKKLVKVNYRLINDSTFGYKVSKNYDKETNLIIDPVSLVWSTFVGGTSVDINAPAHGYIYDMKVDEAGNIYAAGYHNASFPTVPGSYDTDYNGGTSYLGNDVVVFKLNPSGTALVYATYIGGSVDETAYGIEINAAGEAYVTGEVKSTNFPTIAGAYSSDNAGAFDVFVLQLDAAGSSLLYSTLIGGARDDAGNKIAIDASGNAYVTGRTKSSAYPITMGNAFGGNTNNATDAFVTKVNPDGSSLIYSIFIGGTGSSQGLDIKVNAVNEAFVVGITNSSGIATPGAYTLSFGGTTDVLVTRLNSSGSIIYATYLGGTGADYGYALYLSEADEMFITGYTRSSNFPTTPGVYDNSYGGVSTEVFVAKLTPLGGGTSDLVSSTYLGGDLSVEIGYGIAVNRQNEVFVTGYTAGLSLASTVNDFPLTACAHDQTFNKKEDFFISKLSNDFSTLLYSTFIGGAEADYHDPKIRLTGKCGDDEFVISGTSHSINFPTTNGSFQENKVNSTFDTPVVLKFKVTGAEAAFDYTIDQTNCTAANVSFLDTSKGDCVWNSGWKPLNWFWDFGDGVTSSLTNPSHVFTSAGTYSVKLRIDCPFDSVIVPVTIPYLKPAADFTMSPQYTTLSEPTINFIDLSSSDVDTWDWSFGDITGGKDSLQNPLYTYSDTGVFSVRLIVADEFGCADTVVYPVFIWDDFIMYVPNTFTPNEDGKNDVFFPRGSFTATVRQFELLIFDRWGGLIYRTNSISGGWDGRIRGDGSLAKEDVYVWRIKAILRNNEVKEHTGNINLLR